MSDDRTDDKVLSRTGAQIRGVDPVCFLSGSAVSDAALSSRYNRAQMLTIALWGRADMKAELQPVMDALREEAAYYNTALECIRGIARDSDYARGTTFEAIADIAFAACKENMEPEPLPPEIPASDSIRRLTALHDIDQRLAELKREPYDPASKRMVVDALRSVAATLSEELSPEPEPPENLKALRESFGKSIEDIEIDELTCWPGHITQYRQQESGQKEMTNTCAWLAGVLGCERDRVRAAADQSGREYRASQNDD